MDCVDIHNTPICCYYYSCCVVLQHFSSSSDTQTDSMLLLLSFLWQSVHGEREKKSPLKSVEGRKIVSGEREREQSVVSKY